MRVLTSPLPFGSGAVSFAFASGLAWAGCGGGEPAGGPVEYPPVDETQATQGTEEATEPAVAEVTEPPPPPIQVVPQERTGIEGRAPSVRIVSPRNGQTIRRGNVKVRIRVRNWELQPEGQHVHLIIDNEAYIAVRDVRRPIDLNELVQEELGHELTPGTHTLRAFPSRSHHESVKEGTPFAMVSFNYQEATETPAIDAKAPLLTYSRPKGCNKVGEPVLLDFYLSNVETLAADGVKVRYTIGEATGDMTTWAPHHLQNLPAGTHAVRLQLIGADGQPVPGAYNDTTREIQVAEACGPAPSAEEPEASEEEAENAAPGSEPKAAEEPQKP